jgi:hypothetical protein
MAIAIRAAIDGVAPRLARDPGLNVAPSRTSTISLAR